MFLLCETKLTNKTNEKKWNKEKKKRLQIPTGTFSARKISVKLSLKPTPFQYTIE